MVLSPYDIRQSGFTGGGVNAVTRSGTNDIHGSVFGTKRDSSFIGEDRLGNKANDFDQTQWGGRIGGPILRDRLFTSSRRTESRTSPALVGRIDGDDLYGTPSAPTSPVPHRRTLRCGPPYLSSQQERFALARLDSTSIATNLLCVTTM